MSIRIDCCVNIKNSLIKLVGKKWHMRCSIKYLLRFVCLILSKLSRMTHWWDDKICKLIMQHKKSAKKRDKKIFTKVTALSRARQGPSSAQRAQECARDCYFMSLSNGLLVTLQLIVRSVNWCNFIEHYWRKTQWGG